MQRLTGRYVKISTVDEAVQAFLPFPLPPTNPPLEVDDGCTELLSDATRELARLELASAMVPNVNWLLYSFIRKEAVITSQIEGMQATLGDVLTFEATSESGRLDDVKEVCNYIDALLHARLHLSNPRGLPLSIPLLCEAHRKLMRGDRGKGKLSGEIRRSQVWIGGRRPETAEFVPPPHTELSGALSALERWWHEDSDLPSLVRVGLAHVQFETIHPFRDGNGRIGRLLIALLLEHWGLLEHPILYVSTAFKAAQQEYYTRLKAVRTQGDWEGWIRFFLICVREAAADSTRLAQRLIALICRERRRVLTHDRSTVAAIQLLELLPTNPIITVNMASEILELTAPASRKAVLLLDSLGILREVTGKRRGRMYAFQEYIDILSEDRGFEHS